MFRLASVVSAILSLALFPLLLLNSGFYVQSYGVTADAGADFLGRRASPMFLGLAVLLWMGRGIGAGAARDAICYGMAAMWAGIAATGIYEFSVGTAQPMIVAAAALELVLAMAFLVARRR